MSITPCHGPRTYLLYLSKAKTMRWRVTVSIVLVVLVGCVQVHYNDYNPLLMIAYQLVYSLLIILLYELSGPDDCLKLTWSLLGASQYAVIPPCTVYCQWPGSCRERESWREQHLTSAVLARCSTWSLDTGFYSVALWSATRQHGKVPKWPPTVALSEEEKQACKQCLTSPRLFGFLFHC